MSGASVSAYRAKENARLQECDPVCCVTVQDKADEADAPEGKQAEPEGRQGECSRE